MHNNKSTVIIALIYCATLQLLVEFGDDLKETKLYDSALKRALKTVEKILAKNLQRHFKLFKTDQVEKDFYTAMSIPETFAEIIRQSDLDTLPKFSAFLECYKNGEVAEISDEQFSNLKTSQTA
ncbi:MAG: hypothetical protein AB8B69_16555 [Chitinophagales bacterium]